MKRFLSFLFSVFLFSASSVHAANWQELDTGIFYQKITIQRNPSVSRPAVVHVFKIDSKKYEFRPLLAAPNKKSPINRMAKKAGALIGVNANFFDPQGNSLGLVVSNKKTINPFKKISWWGIFQVKRSIPSIIHSSQWYKARSITTALQAGPRLVVNGRIPKLKTETSQKTAIGINKKREVILLTTLYPLEIKELAQLMAKPESKGGLGCVQALNFDGGSSSQMYARVGSFRLNLPSYVDVPVGLGVFRKKR